MSDVAKKPYELAAHSWQEILSKPGQPLDYVIHRKGDTVDLDVETARRFLRDGLVVDPDAPTGENAAVGQSVAPGGPVDDEIPVADSGTALDTPRRGRRQGAPEA